MIDLPLKPKPIQELVDQLDELLAEVKKRIEEGIPDKSGATGKNDTPLVPGAPKTSVQDLRKVSGHDSMSMLAKDIIREYQASKTDNALTYIKMARRFSQIPGIGRTKALQIAAETFPGSYKDYVARQNRGETLPILFPRPGAEQRLARALATGGRIS